MEEIMRSVFVTLFVLVTLHQGQGHVHSDVMRLLQDKMNSSVYNNDVRPILNQSETVKVATAFQILSLISLDEVSQSFVCNGLVRFMWTDELIRWDPADYGGHALIHPKAKNIWRPRVVLFNTLGDRDIFEDDYAPAMIDYTGYTTWLPGSIFSTSCQLDMTQYPFDKQICRIVLVSMGYTVKEVEYEAVEEEVLTSMYYPNGEWQIVGTKVSTGVFMVNNTSTVNIQFTLRRNPTYHLINIVLPVVFLSALNLMVFIIPVESGEKISYGITVLLALSVFLSIVSSMLPRTSTDFPKVTIYLFILLIISVLTVIDSIIIVYLHHKEEKVAKKLKAEANFKSSLNKVTQARRTVKQFQDRVLEPTATKPMKNSSEIRPWSAVVHPTSLTKPWPYSDSEVNGSQNKSPKNEQDSEVDQNEGQSINRYQMIGKHIDLVSFIVFTLIWVCLTLGFMINLSSDY